ncbi:urease accessory protein UreD [Gordonia sp. HY442]|uniref:urease accessory protein UreD n=1 Tax=Gordonia zhenghanii TaxID=2911516 RepID=UPI001F0293F7|nr:urease accessory protein UreD [Gordonia zhenghanii]MCF8608209.1 urease accessory protein UreD [Gordonia zhenghanii]
MITARIAVDAAPGRARVDLSTGAGTTLVPRLLGRTASSARVALVAGGAMLLGGDAIGLDIRVGTGCTLDLTEVGGTVAYDADGEASHWATRVIVESGATLIWRGLETVVADGANLHRRTEIVLADHARALVRDVCVLGRSGERGGRLCVETTVTVDDVPLLVESIDVHGDRPMPGVLGPNRVIESIVLAGIRPGDPDAHTMETAGPGALARYLGHSVHESPLAHTWDTWRRLMEGDD